MLEYFLTMRKKQVCIIGCGISGLVSAKTFLEEGYDVTVFEKQSGIGGVWERSRSYLGVTTQSTKDIYAFSDYPMPGCYPDWPTGKQVQEYLESYARYFGVAEKIKFNAQVTNVERITGRKPVWVVTVRVKDCLSQKTTQEKHEFDFVVVCNGTFNIPKVPSIPGKDDFIASGGKVLHSTEFNDTSLIENKRVIVVGFGRSAADIATITATLASECYLFFRRASWKIPKFFLGLINFKYILFARWSEAFIPYRYLQGVERLLHTFGLPLVWAFWKIFEMILRIQFRLSACNLLPNESAKTSFNCNANLASERFYEYVLSGKIQPRKTVITRFFPGGVELANGETFQADTVIFGTGFQQDIPFLQEKYRRMVMDEKGNFHFYRNLIHPDIPDMGFVGYNSSFFCPLTSEIGAWWLVEHLNGNLALPSRLEIYKEMQAEWQWMQSNWSYGKANGTCVAPFNFHYLEQLINDIGVQRQYSAWKRFVEIMMPVNLSSYKQIREKINLQRRLSIDDCKMDETVKVR